MCVIAESISVANVLPFEALKETADLTKQTPLIAVVTVTVMFARYVEPTTNFV